MSRRRWTAPGGLWGLGRTTAELAAGRRRWQALMEQAVPTLMEQGAPTRKAARVRPSAPRDEGASRSRRLREIRAFGPNPGRLRCLAYAPATLPRRAPLVVALHGCTQTAHDYDRGTGWSTLAERHGFAVLLPEQRKENNSHVCFNWFEPGHTSRDAGEVASIREMIRHLVAERGIDPRRIYVTGLSAGAAMAGALLATYPELFAGGALIAGLPFGAAGSVSEAFHAMFNGRELDAKAWGALVREAAPTPSEWPSVSVWHGTADRTVSPVNAEASVRQWLQVHGLAGSPPAEHARSGLRRRVWRDAGGKVRVEEVLIDGMGHGAPVSGEIGRVGRFFPDHGVSSTLQIAQGWGLTGREVVTAVAQDPEPAGPPSSPAGAQARAEEREPQGSIADTIQSALRTAGLLR
ncbi:MAG: PHB depolymerase family esterase [Alsobacter sp.]